MKVRVKTHDSKPLFYETEGACAFDFRAKDTSIIKAGEMGYIDTGVVIEIPKGYSLLVLPRSSTYKNFSLIQVNGVGVIDNDYCGPNDTIGFQYYNIGKSDQIIEKGTRIGQGIFVSIGIAEFEFVDKINNNNRGGFGTTGNK